MSRNETDQIRRLLGNFNSSSSSTIYQALVDVRTKIIRTEEKSSIFVLLGGIQYLTKFLQKPNDKILDVTLSILGNCCLKDEARVQVCFTFDVCV